MPVRLWQVSHLPKSIRAINAIDDRIVTTNITRGDYQAPVSTSADAPFTEIGLRKTLAVFRLQNWANRALSLHRLTERVSGDRSSLKFLASFIGAGRVDCAECHGLLPT